MSRAMVTPSLVIVGAPNFLSRTTLRPLGPIVTFTASASRSTPRLRDRRADSSKTICFAKSFCPPLCSGRPGSTGGQGQFDRLSVRSTNCLVFDDRQDVLLADDEEILAVHLELGTGVLRVQDPVANLDVLGLALAVIEDLSRAGGEGHAQ